MSPSSSKRPWVEMSLLEQAEILCREADDALSYRNCPQHGGFVGEPCAVCVAEQQPTNDILARFSMHHSLWRGARHDIEQLQAAEDRQDAALTEVESAVAELGGLFDRLTQLECAVEEMRRLVARANLRDRA
jgi:hypothetical protein